VGLAVGVEVVVRVPLGSGLGLRLTLGLVLGLVLGLTEGLGLGLVVVSLLWLPLDDEAGAVVVWVSLVAELVPVCVADEGVEDGEQDVLGAGSTTGLLETRPGGGGARVMPTPPAVPPGPLPLLEGLLLVKA
jgi:hypothetical protein